MKKSELRTLIREEVRKILKEDTFESFKKDLDQVVKHAGVLSLKDDVITIYLDDEPNKEKNIINKLFREKYKDSLRKIVSEPDVIKFKIVKKELNESLATEIAAMILIPALFSAMTAGAIHTIASVADVISWGSDKVSDLAYDIQAWWKKNKNNQPINAIIKRIKNDPEVQEFIKDPNKKGWQKMLASKLTPEEQKYLRSIYRTRFKK
jgi:hypothetical protein